MNTYLENWLKVIENMKNDNTYKLAWGRAIIECIVFNRFTVDDENTLIIKFDDISKCMIKYYWNQIFFFNLKQDPYKGKQSEICKYTNVLIDRYKEITSSTMPVWHDKGLEVLLENDSNLYTEIIKKVNKTLHQNVSHRFLNVNKEIIPLYEYDKKNSRILFDYNEAMVLNDYAVVVSQLLNYRWAQLLEKFNYAPKIANKVNSIAQTKIDRNDLKKYKEELLKQYNGKAIDFYTGKELDKNDISVDHVIPWSFMYSDDIWNLVLTSRSNNSSKSNSIPSQEVIDKLKERNKELLNYLDGKFKDDIELAILNGYVDKFYFESRL